MRILLMVLISLVGLSAHGQTTRILVIGEGLSGGDPRLLEKLRKDLAAGPEAVILTGDILRKRHRLNKNPLVEGPVAPLLAEYKGPVYLVPGEFEYGPYQNNSTQQLAAIKESLSEYPVDFRMVPGDGCPGPYVVELPTAVLIFINTTRFLHQGEVIPFSECGLEDEASFFSLLGETLMDYRDRPALVIGHHPVRSRGAHAGYFPWYTHLLPPVLGSVYAGFRKYIGGLQDMKDDRYSELIGSLAGTFSVHEGVWYISGHEAYFHYDIVSEKPPKSQIISGALSGAAFARMGETDQSGGISLEDYLYVSSEDGYVNIALDRLYASSQTTDKVTVAYRKASDDKVSVSYFQGLQYLLRPTISDTSFAGDVVTSFATVKLERKKRKNRPGLMGNNYRDEWSVPIANIPVFDLNSEKGGLKIVKQGGGQQTRSLRLEADNEKQYVLRSVEKFPEAAVPLELRGTLAEDIIADQISASHPYGALAIPGLAEAAGVYHANPVLMYLPDDPGLREYRDDFADKLYLFEERADDEYWADAENFGNAPEIVSTADVIEKMHNDADHLIDEEQVVRSRLFDIWIGDWDRHDDQWRWAKYEDDQEIKHYRPIPRDRDQAFFWSDGRLLNIGSRKWGQPKFQGFEEEIRDVGGLSYNARYFDRTFMKGSEKQVWLDIARDMQSRLTDEVIENSVRDLPPEVFALHGEDIIRKLKVRRLDLQRYASEYYDFLAETVVVPGSEEAERFEISYLSGDTTRVRVYRIGENSREQKYLAYQRHFHASETREIWLYGREGDDMFDVSGDGSRVPKIRIVGGKGKDSLLIDGLANGQKNVRFYDKKESFASGKFHDKRSDNRQVNQYNRYWFNYNKVVPIITGGFNPDDGVFLGGGVQMTFHGFRKEPFANQHKIVASVAPASASYNLSYRGEFTDVVGKSDFLLNADLFEPSYGDFFYGFGNKTNFNESIHENNRQFYRVRYSQRILEPLLRTTSRNGHHVLTYGPYFRSVKIRRDENTNFTDRFIIAYSELVGRGEESEYPLLDTRRNYAGASLAYDLDLRDSRNFPRNGLFWHNQFVAAWQLGEEQYDHQRVLSAMSVYFTFGGALKATIAGRVGGQLNWGDFEFYQSARLGGLSNLRGYRKLRFAGDQSFYYNLELRVQVLSFRSVLFPALAGFYVFRDQGRVWSDNPDSLVENPDMATWHRGLGAGLWIAPLGELVISTDYAWSNDEEGVFFVRLGFFF